MIGVGRILGAVWLLLGLPWIGQAQTLFADFEKGTAVPAGWRLEGGAGRWERKGGVRGGRRVRGASWRSDPTGVRAVSVTGTGEDMSYWRRAVPGLKPNTLYRIHFMTKAAPGSAAWTVIGGLDVCNRDFSATPDWQPCSFVFTTPDDVSTAFLRLGQWHLKGTIFFDDVTLAPVQPVYTKVGGAELGAGERVEGRTYEFSAPFAEEGSNSARPLVSHTAAFNSNRWVFTGGSQVTYRFTIPGARQTGAQITFDINYYVGGNCVVQASRDGENWVEVGQRRGLAVHTLALPESLFPASAVWVRLLGASAVDAAGNAAPGAFQIDRFIYRTSLEAALPAAEGATRYLEVVRQDPRLTVHVEDLGRPGLEPQSALRLTLRPAPGVQGEAIVSLNLWRGERETAGPFARRVALRPGKTVSVRVPYRCRWTGSIEAQVRVERIASGAPSGAAMSVQGRPMALFLAAANDYIPDYYRADYGYALPPLPEGDLWWCEAPYKISPRRAPPVQPHRQGGGLFLSAARREREHVQLVLHPRQAVGALHVSVSDLVGPGGARIPKSAVEVREVAYVRVRQPTDRIGVADEWPDPLPPLEGGVWRPQPNRNNPLWFTLAVPVNARAGDYTGKIILKGARRHEIPLHLHVWNFALPERTALRSGFGISPDNIRRYHNLKSDAAMAKVWDLYMREFARRRLAPYNPMALAPFEIKTEPELTIDFTAFDKAARRYLDELGFNAFTVYIPGLGGGRYPNYDRGSFAGYAAGTPEYEARMATFGRQLQEHLEKNGWLDRAYVYWYDEPEVNDYPFVRQGMERLRRYAPKLKRMLTEEFQPELFGHVDLWCPITPNFSADPAARRQKRGEEVWWYVCTGPKEPYCTLFIDHPAIEMRMWLWQTWKYGVQGILIWETTYWTSPPQFPDRAQNPWEDPMSYVYGPSGVWGNGDGRFYYPPNRRPNEDTTTEYLTGPVISLRWEMLADGVEDWEYFHLLDGLVKRAVARGDRSAAVERARRLLAVPKAICRDMTHFTTDPLPLLRHRAALAKAIETLYRY